MTTVFNTSPVRRMAMLIYLVIYQWILPSIAHPEPAEYMLLMETLSETPFTAKQIKDWSRNTQREIRFVWLENN